MTFYEKIAELCKKNGVSITKMATDLGFSRSASTAWRACQGNPRASTAKKIADYFKIEIDYFYDETSAPVPTQDIGPHSGPQIAFNGGMDDLTPEEFDKVYAYIQFLKSQRK